MRATGYLRPTLAATVLADDRDVDEAAEHGKLNRGARAHALIGSLMLTAITPAQVQDVVSLLDQLSQGRKARAEGATQSPDEIGHDPQRLMLVGRGDVEHACERAAEICLKYTSADDQVAYLMSKTVRLAEYLKIGMLGIVATIHRQHKFSGKTVVMSSKARPATASPIDNAERRPQPCQGLRKQREPLR
jgi:hypothetical protein